MPDSLISPAQPFINAHELCEAAVDYVLKNVNTVQYLIHSIEEITGRPFTRDRVKCLPAVPLLQQQRMSPVPPSPAVPNTEGNGNKVNAASGQKPAATAGGNALTLRPDQIFAGYMWRRARPDCEKGDIVLVEEHLPQTAHMEETSSKAKNANPRKTYAPGMRDELLEERYGKALHQTERNIRHELIHAFDDARGIIDSADCTHQACSEIRAARLSGDCFAGEEAKKGRFSFFQGGVQCVRRRATMAVEMNPVCRGFSERAVETVFKRCYSDYEPFVAPIYALGSYGDDKFENGTLKL